MKRRLMIVSVLSACVAPAMANDWPFWRGPEQSGLSRERAVVRRWSQDGENLLWEVPVGGRSTPIVMDGRAYLTGPVGDGTCLQERVVCLDADTGKMLWEHRFNVFHTDIVENRVGWTAPVGDPETGYVYVHGTGGQLFAFDRDGNIVWEWSLTEEYGRQSGYGGRLHTPVLDEDRVIISFTYILTQWDTGPKKAGHRYYAFDKRTGKLVWVAQPGGRPLNTTYSAPVVTYADGKRLLIAPNADGNIYGLIARTGEKVWTYRFSKAGLNATGVADGKHFYLAHSEENLKGTVMGSIVCVDVTGSGDVTDTHEVWRVDGIQAGYSSLALGPKHVYAAENSGMMHAFDPETGEKAWEHDLGRAMKGSPIVTADSVIYVGEVNGFFHILEDAGDTCVSLDVEEFTRPDNLVVEIQGSPALADGRVYFQTRYGAYALGEEGQEEIHAAVPPLGRASDPPAGPPARMLVIPPEVAVEPGQSLSFSVRQFDEAGRPVERSAKAEWSVEGPIGQISGDGRLHAATALDYRTGRVRAKVGDLMAEARVRITLGLPIDEDFDDMPVGKIPPGWIGTDANTELIEMDGSVVLHKKAERPSAKYARMFAFSGPPVAGGYTVRLDMMGTPKKGRHPTMSDMGSINTRYKMMLLGREKAIRIVTWSPMPRLRKEVPYDWKPNVWYRTKLRVEPSSDEAIIKAKVWPRDEEEPAAWNIEVRDPCPHHAGSPGIYAYSKGTSRSKHGASVYFDNYKVMRND